MSNKKPKIVLVKVKNGWKSHYKGTPLITGFGSTDKKSIDDLKNKNPDPNPFNETDTIEEYSVDNLDDMAIEEQL